MNISQKVRGNNNEGPEMEFPSSQSNRVRQNGLGTAWQLILAGAITSGGTTHINLRLMAPPGGV